MMGIAAGWILSADHSYFHAEIAAIQEAEYLILRNKPLVTYWAGFSYTGQTSFTIFFCLKPLSHRAKLHGDL